MQNYLNGGAAPVFNYHRFWAEADIATAFDSFAFLFPTAQPPSGFYDPANIDSSEANNGPGAHAGIPRARPLEDGNDDGVATAGSCLAALLLAAVAVAGCGAGSRPGAPESPAASARIR